MPRDVFLREKFTKERTAARRFAKDYFEGYPKDRHQTEVEAGANLQSANIEFVIKRLREPGGGGKSARISGLAIPLSQIKKSDSLFDFKSCF
jgi:hypothetical protein